MPLFFLIANGIVYVLLGVSQYRAGRRGTTRVQTLAFYLGPIPEERLTERERSQYLIMGVLFFGIGIGFLIAAILRLWR